ncbi:MAG: YdcF family protein [Alphaproteobacteria bacterium]|nr:YdcF family protein [Alphaproteobacteria bacterium]QQS56606.1 MAG: YdcF family protein [Alphaproteobacteria bacterium]
MKLLLIKAFSGLSAAIFSLWLGGFVLFSFYALTVNPAYENEKTDAIVVVTGGNHRIQTGLDLLAQERAPKLFISGVHEKVTATDILQNWKGNQPKPTCCVFLGHKALTTYGNADETQEWITANKVKSIRLVTSGYHMGRALLEFKRVMPDLKIIPHPVEETDYGVLNWKFWELAFSEYHKILFRLTRMSLEQQ